MGLRFLVCLSMLYTVQILRRQPPGGSAGLGCVLGLRIGLPVLLATACLLCPPPVGAQASASPQPKGDAEQSTETPQPLVFTVPPQARFVTPDSAVVSWETDEPCEGIVEVGVGDKWSQKVRDPGSQRIHRVTLRGLEPKVLYRYRVLTNASGKGAVASDDFELDNALNYSVARVPDGPSPYGSGADSLKYSQAAEQIVSTTGVTRGYCLVLDCNEGQLAYELAKRSELIIFGVGNDRERIARGRALLRKAGVYGSRITLRESLEGRPLPHSYANLIVADDSLEGRLVASVAEIAPLLQPATGVACFGPMPSTTEEDFKRSCEQWLGGAKARWEQVGAQGARWLLVRRELPSGTGSWTHQYGDAGNSANSREDLGGVAGTDRLEVQWLGRPGADFGIDRNPRMPAPLAVNGRLFHQGMNRIIGLDSYNGAVLWSIEVPAMRRVNMPRDAGNWCADPDHLYVAVNNRCWRIEAGTGERERTFELADSKFRNSREWGYVARAGDLLYGSSIKPNSVYTEFWGEQSWYDRTSGQGTEKICSDDLFAITVANGDLRWRYCDGVVINSTIAVADERVLFVECRNPDVRALATSRVGSPKLWENQYLVALNARTGEKLWEKPIDTADGIVVFYLLAAEDKVVIMASASGKYHLYGFSAADGKNLWETGHDWLKDNHGGHLQHPVIVRNTVFIEPCGYDLAAGKLLTKDVGRHGGCATYAATLNALIYRGDGGRISMWDIDRGVVTGWHNLRPSCWLSTVPANGMVLSPEGGGGCSCGNWLETSIGFSPVLSATSK
jgi:outer membrane protein assembly factor BamB